SHLGLGFPARQRRVSVFAYQGHAVVRGPDRSGAPRHPMGQCCVLLRAGVITDWRDAAMAARDQWLVPGARAVLFHTLYLPMGFTIGRRLTSLSVAAS